MLTIFVSYRQSDTAPTTDHLVDRLGTRFGQRKVFQDVGSIPGGVNWERYIERKIADSNILLLIIGPKWLDVLNPDGIRRLDDPADPVRVEIEVALQHHIPVIPVLVDGASMPETRSLPESIRQIAPLNAVVVRRNPHFEADFQKLVTAIRQRRLSALRKTLDRVQLLVANAPKSVRRGAAVGSTLAIVLVAAVILAQLASQLGLSVDSVRPPGSATATATINIGTPGPAATSVISVVTSTASCLDSSPGLITRLFKANQTVWVTATIRRENSGQLPKVSVIWYFNNQQIVIPGSGTTVVTEPVQPNGLVCFALLYPKAGQGTVKIFVDLPPNDTGTDPFDPALAAEVTFVIQD